jgi:hypothetical protein
LGYKLFNEEMPLTNPADIAQKLEEEFKKSVYNEPKNHLLASR